jgi:hypothetical protein
MDAPRDFAEFFARLSATLNSDSRLIHRGRFIDMAFGWGIGDEVRTINILHGKILNIDGPHERPSRSPIFTITAPAPVWLEFSRQVPRPGHHDILAMVDERFATATGDLLPFFSNLFYVKGLLEKLRQSGIEHASNH